MAKAKKKSKIGPGGKSVKAPATASRLTKVNRTQGHRAGAESPRWTVPGPAKSGGKNNRDQSGSKATNRKPNQHHQSSAKIQKSRSTSKRKRSIPVSRKTGKGNKVKSATALKGWKTRRKNQQKKKLKSKRPNQEYIITVIPTNGKKRRGRQFDLFVIGPLDGKGKQHITDSEIIRWTIWYIENHEETENLQWVADLMIWPQTDILVARGPLAHKRRKVELRM